MQIRDADGWLVVGAMSQQHHGGTSSADAVDELTISVDPDTLDGPTCFNAARGCGLRTSLHEREEHERASPHAHSLLLRHGLGTVTVTISVDPDTLDGPICFNAARGCGLRTSLHEQEEHERASPHAHSSLLRHGLGTVTINGNPKAGAVVRMGPCGGSGGDFRKMHMVSEARRIVQIAVRHAGAVDAIRVLYERGGKEAETNWWGWDGGKLTVIRLRRDEYLKSVEGHYSKFNGYVVIRSLKFVSNLRTHGPYGKECGVRFALPAGAGGRIIGFHARSGQYLDAIGTYVKMDDRA